MTKAAFNSRNRRGQQWLYVICQTLRHSETFKDVTAVTHFEDMAAYLGHVTNKNCPVDSSMCDLFQQQKQSECGDDLYVYCIHIYTYRIRYITYIYICIYIERAREE